MSSAQTVPNYYGHLTMTARDSQIVRLRLSNDQAAFKISYQYQVIFNGVKVRFRRWILKLYNPCRGG